MSSFLSSVNKNIINSLLKYETYLVGGCLRDYFLKKPIKDIDILIAADTVQVDQFFSDEGYKKVTLSTKERIFRYVGQDMIFDLTFLNSHSIQTETLENNLLQRDFTINSLAMPLKDYHFGSFNIIDPAGGMQDLKNKTIRCFHQQNLLADPLRLLRAHRLKSQLGFTIEPETSVFIASFSHMINRVAGERIRDELMGMLEYESFDTLKDMENNGLLFHLFPELTRGMNMNQGPYHENDVFTHSMHALKELESLLKNYDISNIFNLSKLNNRKTLFLIKLSALLHDIGKPVSQSINEQEIHFYGHEKIGGEMVKNIASRFKFSRKDTNIIKKLLDNHMRIGHLLNLPQISDRTKRRLIYIMGEELELLLLLFLADALATRSEARTKLSDYLIFCQELINFQQGQSKKNQPLINGEEIMNLLSIPPSREVGRLLDLVEKAREEGKVSNKKQAKQFLSEYFKTECR